ncbi:hypothetical protein CAEBREN_02001 [Caenorhabditis brenneri]|uniref:Uncharacterized protein n=1 Tax=Caenorhabditis brenneri TaxID=135651 RepID=G0N548_CAEBE|nr:hypothetical protein CAEBREN_02001 [Caenorhabditis brenneri]
MAKLWVILVSFITLNLFLFFVNRAFWSLLKFFWLLVMGTTLEIVLVCIYQDEEFAQFVASEMVLRTIRSREERRLRRI